MKKVKTRKRYRLSVSIGIVLIFLLFSAFAYIAFSIFQSGRDELYEERRKSLNEVSEQIAKRVHSICSSSWDVSDAAFSHILASEIENKAELASLLAEVESGMANQTCYLAVIDAQTNYYLSNGSVGLFKSIEFLRESTEKRQVIITSVTFDSSREYMLFLRRLETPLILKDGTRITHTAMVQPPEVYLPAFFSSGYDGSADIFMIQDDGRCIYRRNNTGVFSNAANIMRVLKNVDFLHRAGFEDLKESLQYAEGESFEFEHENVRYFVSLAPVQTSDWVITLIVPTEQMNSGADHFLSTMLSRIIAISAIGILVAVIILCCFISAVNMKLREKQQQQLHVALKHAAEEANSANLAKSEFLSHMSHDLRTPLNAILGMLERAEEIPDMTDELKHCLADIHTASNHLNALINDVLDMSRLESDRATPDERAFDLGTVMDACCSIIHSFAKQHNITFTYRCAGFQHPYILGWDLYLRKLLINVLGNSVKFTREGGSVTFDAEEISCEGKTANFRFIISDTGIGMNETALKQIFEPFWQGNNSARTNYGGTGLGMTIVKKMVDKMGGTIDINSKVNEGSRFTIVLPFTISEKALVACEEKAEQKPLPPSSMQGMTILLCDDNLLNCNIAEHLLKKAGATVMTANNGEEAVEKFQKSDIGSIDAILMDVMMPVMDGLEATEKIRSLPRPDAACIPIVAMTANAFDEDVKKTAAAGMNEHLSKPINGQKLIATLLKYRKHDRNVPFANR